MSLPERPDLDQLRRQAKELLRAARSGDASAVDRVHAVLTPRPGVAPTLSAAQLVIAREHGQPSWPALVAEVHERNQNLIERLTDFVVGSIGGHFDPPGTHRRWQDRALRLIADHPAIASYDIRLAAVLGDAVNLAALLDRDPAAATRVDDVAGWPPLLFVCSSRWHRIDPARSAGLVASARILLEAGADPNTNVDRSAFAGHCSPLYAAAGLANHTELASLLLEYGADPDTPSALYHAVFHRDHACLRLLLDHGARTEGPAALGAAIAGSDTEAVRMLLDAGVDPREPIPDDALGETHEHETHEHAAPVAAVAAAIKGHGDADMVDLLLTHGAAATAATPTEPSSYQLAARRGDPHILDVLHRHGVRADATTTEAFLGACARADRGTAEELVRTEPDLVSRLTDDEHAAIVDAAEHRDASAVALMLDLGLRVDARRDTDGATALHTAANAGHADIVRLLIAAGADVEALDSTFGGTPLSWATVGSGRTTPDNQVSDWVATVAALLDAGANLDGAWVTTKPPSDAVATQLIERGVDRPDE
jgi:ankyrin repeat protein